MKPFDELSERGRLRRLAELGREALKAFGLRPKSLAGAGSAENVTFDVRTTRTGKGKGPGAPYVPGRFLLRLHRPGYHPMQAVRSELAWLVALRHDRGLPVPEPVFARDGSLAAFVEHEGVPEGRVCTLLRWMDGSMRSEKTASPGHMHMVGRLMAGLHEHASSWKRPRGFVRGRWDWYGLFENAGTAGADESWVWDELPLKVRRLYESSARDTADAMDELGDGPDAFGLIHADLHLGNVVFGGGEARAIDFDDCGDGHWLYDMAVALFDHRDKEDWEIWKDSLLSGYSEVREPPEGVEPHLETLMCARCVSLMLWTYSRAAENSKFKRNLKKWTDWSVRYLEEHCAE